MTKDLEATLAELGPGYRPVVERLRAPFEESRPRRPTAYLVAASLTAAALFFVMVHSTRQENPSPRSYTVYTAAYASDAFALRAILSAQRNDGSWSNDYLTMQNAAALRRAGDEVSKIAYKRAVRYLRSKGLVPISDAELRLRTESYVVRGDRPTQG